MPVEVRFALFFGTLALVIGALGVHVVRRTAKAFGAPRWFSRLGTAFVVLGILFAIASRFLANHDPAWARALGVTGGAITLFVMVTSVLLWPYELVRLVSQAVKRFRTHAVADVAQPADIPENMGRRDVLAQVAATTALSIGGYAGGYGTLFGRHDYALEQVPISLAKLPRELDGFRIVQLSDIHIGLFVGERELRAALSLVKDAKPDAIVLTGDLLDHDPAYAPMLGRFVRSLEPLARHGVFAIPGNHDHYAGVASVTQALREGGAEVLLNRGLKIESGKAAFMLAGVDDIQAPRFGGIGPDLDTAFFSATPDLARVLLSHNPAHFPEAHAHADLVLSGHTHGGQVTLFINPAELVLPHGYIRGRYVRNGSQIYVNRGFGTAGPPARVGSPPEVTCITLTV